MRDHLPALLAEIADLTDVATALAIADAVGGTTTTIVSRLSPDNWLVQTVGLDKAKLISHHFTSGKARVKLFVPLGPTAGSYKAERRRRAEALLKAQEEGLSAVQTAKRAGITDRSVFRFRARLGGKSDKDQGRLF